MGGSSTKGFPGTISNPDLIVTGNRLFLSMLLFKFGQDSERDVLVMHESLVTENYSMKKVV